MDGSDEKSLKNHLNCAVVRFCRLAPVTAIGMSGVGCDYRETEKCFNFSRKLFQVINNISDGGINHRTGSG